MRWDELFADLEGQLEAGIDVQERELEAEEERLRLGRLSLRDRVAAIGREALRMRLGTGDVIGLVPRTVGRDWIAGDLDGTAAQAIVPIAALAALLPTAEQLRRSADPPPAGALTDRLGLPFVLRDLARRRRVVEVLTRSGTITGTFDRVGRDHVDLAAHPADEWRRASAVARVEVLALSEIVLVRVD